MTDLSAYSFENLRGDGELNISRGRGAEDGPSILLLSAGSEHPSPLSIKQITHAYSLRDELDSSWAIRPCELLDRHGIPALLLDDPGGEFLDDVLRRSPSLEELLRLAIAITRALGGFHTRQLIHRDIKPANIIVDAATSNVWLTGFGLTSRLPRYRQLPDPPDAIAGTLAYMAPEQTGRMNRSIDSRSDLYSLGVTFYEMFFGELPFEASDPMGWVHCHIAKLPAAPNLRGCGIPEPLHAIILKLLAKTPEERYQTAAGVEADLRRVLSAMETRSAVESFPLGARDVSDRLLIPEKLYGREREIDLLLGAFDRVVTQGRAELVLVSGYSGVGKSSVVNELQKALVAPRGLFASGKFDQYKRDIPYATLAQAFQSLIRPILADNEEGLSPWRDAIRDALGPNGQLMVDLVPELKLIIGEPQPVPELPPEDAQRRFQLVFRRFVGAFTREHPLVLFLDDLQWLDAATLDLMEDLLTHPDVKDLMLIGAYRDNEVASAHPLMRKLRTMRQAGAIVHDIVLAPLTRDDLQELIADSIHCESERAKPLAELVKEKTTGNPFFAIQFFSSLAEESLLTFDYADMQWSWDLHRIHAKGHTDNVVDLMVGKLKRLPPGTQKALQQLACLGNSANFGTLRLVYQDSNDEMHRQLWEAVRTGLIFRSEDSYRFLHDRVQEAAYSLIPQESRAEAHLRIGQMMASHTSPDKLEEGIFEIVNQLNRAAALISSREQKEQLAEFNLIAGKRAKASTAYASALKYLVAGTSLLSNDGWEHRPDLMFAIELCQAECEFLTGELAMAEMRLTMLSGRAADPVDRATIACLHIDLHTALKHNDRAVDVCLAYLHRLGIEWSPHPTQAEARREYERIGLLLGHREIEELIDLPLTCEPQFVAILDVMTRVLEAALFTDEHLTALVTCRMVNLSLEHGNTDASGFGYVGLGMIAGPHFGDYKTGSRFGRLGYDLVERHGLERFRVRISLSFANVIIPWAMHLRTATELIRRAFDGANAVGDLNYAAYSCSDLIVNRLAIGDPLADVQCEAELALEFCQKARVGMVIDIVSSQVALIRTLRGLTTTFGCFNQAQFDELAFERYLASELGVPFAACWYWTRKLQARFLAGDYTAAVDASLNAQRLLWTVPSFFETAEARFYGALSHAACCDSGFPDDCGQHLQAITSHYRQLTEWAENCRENFENRAALVGAEIARIEGRDLDAMRLYELAIRSAHINGFVHNEAVANELAGRYYLARNIEAAGYTYLRKARNCYDRWGADGKVRQLDALYPRLREEMRGRSAKSTIGEPFENLDLATVIKVSEAVSGEIELGKLINTLMRTAIEHAGAERGLLILSRGADYQIEAEATVSIDTVAVVLREAKVSKEHLPESVLQYVIRTKENVLLHNAAGESSFATDEYIHQRRARSVLCLPLLKQTRLLGVMYLENNLATNVFTPARAAVLKLLASQAAISLENTRLYGELQEREARVRRLFDANIIGIFIWNLDGRLLEANEALGQIIGYGRDELMSGKVRLKDLMPVEWDESDDQITKTVPATGIAPSFEAEYVKKDGSRVPVLVSAALFEGAPTEGVAFVLDLTERKRAQEALHRAQIELAHVARVTTMGVFAGSIAHEVSQPLSGIITNASTCLRMLAADPPDVDGARETVKRTIRDGNRASEVIKRLRALFSKRDIAREPVDLNEACREVIALSLSELQRRQVMLQTEFAVDLPSVMGDRVQLQQVILNLLLNASDAMSAVEDRPRRLTVKTEPDNCNHIRFSVQDTGIGLELQDIDKLFEAFHTTKRDGMGIGLSVSRSIIEHHCGRLWAAPNDGHGATFSFSLPCAG
jgi:PAS domain S-box-containing protein